MQFEIRPAKQSDSASLIALTKLTPMKGNISIRIDRDPDFFALSKLRGETKNFVAVNKADDLIIGSFSYTPKVYYSFGKPVNVYYLADLKIHPEYSKSRVAYVLVKHVQTYLRSIGANLLYCTAVNDNFAVMSFFNGKAGIPVFKKLATFNIYQLFPKKGKAYLPDNFNVAIIANYYQESFKNHSFCSSFKDVENCHHFIHVKENMIIAAISVYDPSAAKKNIILKIPFSLLFIIKLLRLVNGILTLPEIPVLNAPLKILFVKYFAYDINQEVHFDQLLQKVRAYAFVNHFHLISISTDERDIKLNQVLKANSLTKFTSIGLITCLEAAESSLHDFCKGLCYEDFSLT